MKIRQSRRQTAKVSHSRWLAYATASVATALAGSHSAEAAIHYSGILNVRFRPHQDDTKTFPLDQAGDSMVFQRLESSIYFGRFDVDLFQIHAIGSYHGFRTANVTEDTYKWYVSKLHFGQNVSGGFFASTHTFSAKPHGAFMAFYPFSFYARSPWKDGGVGYVGFRFKTGAGLQYGWVRVRMSGPPEHAFEVVDYAYGDVGDRIRAGQRSSNEMVREETDDIVPQEGSLGALALGAAGLLAWRKSRSRAARLEST